MNEATTFKVIRRAFTAVELVLVVLILAIVAVNVAPTITSTMGRQRVRAAAARLQSDLYQAQSRAIHTSVSQQLAFDVAASEYVVTGVADLAKKGDVYQVDFTEPPYLTTVVTAEFASSVDSDVNFNSLGFPDSGGQIVLKSGQFQTTLQLLPESGHVAIGPVVEVP